MKKVIPILLFSILLGGCTWFGTSPKAALDIKSDPVAAVYLDDNHVGVTPFYRDDLKPGDYTVKLVVESNQSQTWQTQVTLKPQLLTNITRNFGPSEDTSSHFILSLDKGSKADASQVTIITQPETVVVKQDGQPLGFTPKEISLPAGDFQIGLNSSGYKPILIPINAIAGYHLTISAKLAKDKDMSTPADPNATSSAQLTPNPSPASPAKALSEAGTTTGSATNSAKPAKPYVTINETETGWLRVRSEPTGTSDNEIGKVNIGQSYPFKIANQTGWYQIEYAPGKLGWISAKYATLVE